LLESPGDQSNAGFEYENSYAELDNDEENGEADADAE
jgi:hypothetical protein